MNLKRSKLNIIAEDIFDYTSRQYISQFIGFFTSVYIKRVLGPVNIGVWNTLKVVMGYVLCLNLGVDSTVAYKIPILKGKGKTEERKYLTQVAFNFMTVIAFVGSMGIAMYAVFLGRDLPKELFVGLLVLSAVLMLQRFYAYYTLLLRANRVFNILGRSMVFDAVINFILVLLVLNKFGLYGFYVVIILTPVLNVLFIRRYVTFDLRFSFDLRGVASQIKFGLPIFINQMLFQVLRSVDKIMILGFLGIEQLGFYSIALMGENYGSGIAKNFGIVIQPHFLEDFGAYGMERSATQVVFYSRVTASLMAIILSVFFLSAPVFIHYVLPAFNPGITALKIFFAAIFFISIYPYSSNFLVALGKQKTLIPATILAIVLNIALNYTLIKAGHGINGAAMATVMSSFLYFVLLFVYALGHCQGMFRISLNLTKVLCPLIYCAICVLIVERIVWGQHLILQAFIRIVVFIFLSLPLIYQIDKETGIIKILGKALLSKFKARHTE